MNSLETSWLTNKGLAKAEYIFSKAHVFKQYERSVYNLLDVLTTLGGLFSALNVIGLMFTRIFSYNLLLSSIIRKLYHFKPKFESEIKVKKKKKDRKVKKRKSALEEFKAQQDHNRRDGEDSDAD